MTLMLLDSAGMYFRAFHALPESLTAPDGSPVNAVRGFVDMTARLVSTRRPDRLVACLDADWRPAFRVAALPSYKGHRVATGGEEGAEAVPDTLAPQVPVIEDVLDAVGIARLGVAGYEADDVIATLAARESGPVEVVSGDRDLFGVVRDAGGGHGDVRVLYIGRGLAKLEVVGPAEVTARYGVPGRAYPDFAALRGDPSDGLPGVAGIGTKSAAALVTRFGSLPGILDALDRGETDGFPAGARARLAASRDYLAAAWEVVRAREDLPVPGRSELSDALPAEPADPARLVELSTRWGLDSPLSRLLAALTTAGRRAPGTSSGTSSA